MIQPVTAQIYMLWQVVSEISYFQSKEFFYGYNAEV